MRIYVQLLQNYLKQQIPTIILSVQAQNFSQKYIFNMPTCFQRFIKDHKQKFPKGSNIFFTKASSETLAGLSGFMLTIFQSKMCQDTKLFVGQQIYKYLQEIRYKMGFKILPYSYHNLFTKQNRSGIRNIEKVYDLLGKQNYAQIFRESQKYIQTFLSQEQRNQSWKYMNENNQFFDGQLKIISFQVQSKGQKIINYICIPRKLQGKVLPQKMKQYKIPPKLTSKLLSQGSLTLQDGTVIKAQQIKSPDLPSPNLLIFHYNSIQSIIKICTNQKLLIYLKNPQNITQSIIHIFQTKYEQNLIQSYEYKNLLTMFPKQTKHIIYNRNYRNKNYQIQKQPISKHLQLVSFVNKYFPNCMPDIMGQHYQYIKNHKKNNKILQQIFKNNNTNIYCYKRCYQLVLAPKKNQGYNPININQNNIQKQKKQYNIPLQSLINPKQIPYRIPQQYNNFKQCDPRVIFLGTGSMKPSKYRNVSSIYVQMTQNISFLLDCGQGSYYQLFNHFGYQKIDQILLNIKCIFITHIHSDHNLGILDLIAQRNKLLAKKYNKNNISPQQYNKYIQNNKLYLIIPYNVLPWFDSYIKNIQNLLEGCQILFIQTLLKQQLEISSATISKDQKIKKQQKIQRIKSQMKDQKQQDDICQQPNQQLQAYYSPYLKYLLNTYTPYQQKIYNKFIQLLSNNNIQQFQPVHVDHCPQSFGIVIKHKNGIKISYSGDCRPSQNFIKSAHKSTLLIHQATFGDDLLNNAIENMHTTVGQAIDIAIKSQSWKLALTHFSQRYISAKQIVNPSLYKLNQNKRLYALNHSIVCFDHLRMKMSQLPILAYQSRKICEIFPSDSQE